MIEKTETTASVPLPLDEIENVPLLHDGAGQEPGEAESESTTSAAPPLLFRGLPICWAVSQQTRQVVEKNAFGPDTISERPGRKFNFIEYGGKLYQKEEFYQAAF